MPTKTIFHLYTGFPVLTTCSTISAARLTPPARVWQSTIPCEIGIKIVDYLPLLQNRDQLDEVVESAILLYSRPRDIVVSCFMPSVDILSIINRSDRLGIVADPDPKRSNAVISDWKKAGLKAERVN